MNKAELIKAVAAKTGKTQVEIKATLADIQDVVMNTLKKQDVTVFDGLTLKVKERPAHIGRNPITGESLNIPAKNVPKATFGKAFKDAVA